MTKDETQNSKTDLSNKEPNQDAEVKTLGILLVHGIGTQRRGDILVQFGEAIHRWLHEWLTHGHFGKDVSVDVMETNLVSNISEPANTRIVFRQEMAVNNVSWLLAESHWAETFRSPKYLNLVRWACVIVPWATLLHLVHPFRRAYEISEALREVFKTGRLTPETWDMIMPEIGPIATVRAFYGDLTSSNFALDRLLWRILGRICFSWFILPVIALVGLLTQAGLILLLGITIFPIKFLRSFASSVQKTLAATIGDSYLFLSSPFTESAIITKVQQDLEWLMKRCDRVVIIAHSQGAAVIYRAIEQWAWQNRVSEKLKLLITYGSGIRKLFDLRSAISRPFDWTFYGVIAFGCSGLLGVIVIFFMFGKISLLLAAFGVVMIYMLLGGVLLASSNLANENPVVLPIEWDDLYASHDPVPNGPLLTVLTPKLEWGPDKFWKKWRENRSIAHFNSRRHEVVNNRSFFSDHTTYWLSTDDFVAKIATRLTELSNFPIQHTLPTDWFEVSAKRRHWRVKLFSGFRIVAGLAIFFVFFLNRNILGQVGSYAMALIRDKFGWLLSDSSLVLEWVRNPTAPEWLIGVITLIVLICILFIMATKAWRMWERKEVKQFFGRVCYQARGIGVIFFAACWLGLIGIVPLVTILTSAESSYFHISRWWIPIVLFLISGCSLWRADRGPGTSQVRGLSALREAEGILSKTDGDRVKNMKESQFCFRMSVLLLKPKRYPNEWVRAVLGLATTIEQLNDSNPKELEEIIKYCNKALEVLGLIKRDTSDIRECLKKMRDDLSQRQTKSQQVEDHT